MRGYEFNTSCYKVFGMMKVVVYISLVFAYFNNVTSHRISVDQLREIANAVNKADTTWKAVIPDDIWSGHDHVDLRIRLGVLETPQPAELSSDQDKKADYCGDNGLPKEFDARKHWPECGSVIGHIYDQGNCGSCWAVATTSVFTDRVCIASKGKITALYSIQQMTSCCHKCKLYKNETNGCEGGWPLAAWAYIKRNGLSTGGDYNSKQGCQPYLMRNCDHHVEKPILPACSSLPDEKAPSCKLHCYNTHHSKSFRKDRIKVENYYKISPCAAMNEIYTYGPIASFFTVYEDFYTYKSGVYQHEIGKKIGLHVVRVIGWGEENGVPYWLAANSWNEHWGDKGLFKVKRGSNEVWFEDNLSAGRPKIL